MILSEVIKDPNCAHFLYQYPEYELVIGGGMVYKKYKDGPDVFQMVGREHQKWPLYQADSVETIEEAVQHETQVLQAVPKRRNTKASKIDPAKVLRMRKQGKQNGYIAKEFGVSVSTIQKILGKTRK